MHTEQARDKKRQRKMAKGLQSNAPTPPMTPGHATPSTRRASEVDAEVVIDAERGEVILYERDWKYLGLKKKRVVEEQKIKPSWRDINPLPIMATIFAKPTNAIVLLSSGVLFAAQYTVTYTAAITLARYVQLLVVVWLRSALTWPANPTVTTL